MREQICEAVRAEVISGEMTNDQPLREQPLAKRFGVSRSSVRDALLQLSQEGVLVYKPNKGVRVSSPSSDAEFRLYAKLRKEIEWHCLNICMDQMTEDDDRNLTNLLAALEDSCRRGNLSSITEIDLAMHPYSGQSCFKGTGIGLAEHYGADAHHLHVVGRLHAMLSGTRRYR